MSCVDGTMDTKGLTGVLGDKWGDSMNKAVDLNKLQAMLTETFNKWAKETENGPNFFTVENIKECSLEGGGNL